MTFGEALKIADRLTETLRPMTARCEVAGSVRRLKPTDIKDVELCAIPAVGGGLFGDGNALADWLASSPAELGRRSGRTRRGQRSDALWLSGDRDGKLDVTPTSGGRWFCESATDVDRANQRLIEAAPETANALLLVWAKGADVLPQDALGPLEFALRNLGLLEDGEGEGKGDV